jgi:coenzyme F420 hydrogenase subunit beta
LRSASNGICHSICPEVGELDEEMKRQLSWSAPIGRVIETTVARAKTRSAGSRHRRRRGTALLLHLLDIGRIDGAM